jgi:hypothetical protein
VIETTYAPVSYTGNGVTTTFPFTFDIDADTEIVVTEVIIATGVETVKTLTTHYTISGQNVEAVSAPASTVRWVISRVTAKTQLVDLVENDALPTATVEAALDKNVKISQEVAALIDRSLRQPNGDSAAIGELPAKVTRASKYLIFDADGDPTVSTAPTDTALTTAFTETLLDDEDGDTFVNTLIGDGLSDHGAVLASGDQFAYRDVDQDTGGRTTVVEILGQGTNALTEDTTPDTAADFLLTYDASASTAKKVKPENIGAKKLATLQATTSGTSIDFTSIPAGVTRITIMLSGVSTNGTSKPLIQIGDAGGIEPTGYLGSSTALDDSSAVAVANFTTGFGINSASAANILHGTVVLTLMNAATFLWAAHGNIGLSNSTSFIATGGVKALSAALDRVRITTVNGTDAFDAGSINIMYER